MKTSSAAFATDGSDGVVVYEVEEGDVDEPGIWQVRARVYGSGKRLSSEFVRFPVTE